VFKDNMIQDYNDLRENNERWVNGITGSNSTADPTKAMDVLVDVVRGEGAANGRDMPLYLVLGEDAAQDLRNTGANMSRVLDEWEDVTRSVHTLPCTARKEDTES
jgi:predicted  nucleic acid-binding Zn ribbon protein